MPELVRLAFTDDPRLRALKSQWMERIELEAEQARILAQETLRAIEDDVPVVKPGSAPGDWQGLRGFPLISRGVRGEMPNTRAGCERSLRRLGKALEVRSWGRLTIAASNGHVPASSNGHRPAC